MFRKVGGKTANCSTNEELKEESEDLLLLANFPDGEGAY